MGMFDNIKCKYTLPLSEELKSLNVDWKETTFQTKDLDNCLLEYIITESGELVEEVVEYDYVYFTEEEKKEKNYRSWSPVKEQIEKNRHTKRIDFHGKITFYELFDISDEEDIWVDFEAYFIYGKLDKILLSKTEKQKSRKINIEKFFEKQEKLEKSFIYKAKKYLGWFWFWRKTGHICYKISILFSNLNMFIIKYIR